MGFRIDGLQDAKWSEGIIRKMRAGGIDAVHVAIAETEVEVIMGCNWHHLIEARFGPAI